jgi:hypothetical protein
VASSAALVHVWPTTVAHPIDHARKPVVRAAHGHDAFLRDARAAVAGKLDGPAAAASPLCAELLTRIVTTL